MMRDPAKFWNQASESGIWRDFILPRKSQSDFDSEGWVEAQRLFYFFDGSSTVVDYGCGVGRVLQYVAERAGSVVGIDISSGFIRKAKESTAAGNVRFFKADRFMATDFADLVYCLMVMQHNDHGHREEIMGHIYRLLKLGGMAVVSFPRYESTYYEEGAFIHKFKREDVADLASMFRSCRIVEGNLPNYEKEYAGINEYFLIGVK